VVGAIVGVTSLVMCVVLVMLGISNGLSALLGGRVWAGELIAGFGILFIIAAALGIAIGSAKSAAHRKTLEKYEQLRRDQKIAFERSAAERVAAAHR
jgi:uncharacterized membrane protein